MAARWSDENIEIFVYSFQYSTCELVALPNCVGNQIGLVTS